MYGGTFTDAAHTKYTADSAENIKAIQTLHDADGINFDASKMCIRDRCWTA